MKTLFRWMMLPLLALGVAGCDYDNDNDDDYDPPAGRGALLVDNNTSDEIRVYVDGEQLGRVDDYSDRPFDLEPGVHRVVLDQVNGDRNFRDDIDIIEGRLTVLDVQTDFDFGDDDYDVEIFFD
jgi:hypothetical protein